MSSDEISDENLEELDFETQCTFFDDFDNLSICIEELTNRGPSFNTNFFLKVISFWIEQKWSDIEQAFSVPLHTLLFQVLMEKYFSYEPEMQNNIGKAQA